MAITLYHHPYSRAATVVWMLEELGQPYSLEYVDLRAGAQKEEPHLHRNRMGKLPVLVDDGTPISETAAIGLYLADRYAPGTLAPALDDPARGAYLRWAFYGPSVVEPGCTAHNANWETRPSAVGWGRYEDMLATLEEGLQPGPWLLGDRFTMADLLLGATVRWMLMFKMLDSRPAFEAYKERLEARPAFQRAAAINQRVAAERGLGG